MTTLYREQKNQILKPEFAEKGILPQSESFDRKIIDRLLAQGDCVGIRIYFGMSHELQLRAIVVGYNSKNEDILPASEERAAKASTTESTESTEGGEEGEGIIAEEGMLCPPLCPPKSNLNP